MTEWHHLLGISLKDFFFNSSYQVEVERDLSLKKQFLDVLIIEKKEGSPPSELPDGLENLSAHNLITYKSHQESLDSWALDELTGHYVSYRKMISPDNKLIPADDFRMYALSARYPEKLAKQTDFKHIKKGVCDVVWGVNRIRVIVLSLIPLETKNAVWNMFSAIPDNVRYAWNCYHWQIREITTLIAAELLKKYQIEGVPMPYTVEDFIRNAKQEVLQSFTIDERIMGITADELLKKLSLKERLSGLRPEEIEAYLRELQNKQKH